MRWQRIESDTALLDALGEVAGSTVVAEEAVSAINAALEETAA